MANFTLPAKYYVDPDHFKAELEEFFFKDWICVGRADQIAEAGAYFVREVGAESIIVVRGADQRVRAHYNVCRHRGTQLCQSHEGKFKGSIQCPYHAWTFALDGRLVGAPQMDEVNGFRLEDYPLNSVHCETWAGNIFVNFSKTPKQSLLKQLGTLVEKFVPWKMEDLRLGVRHNYRVQANWKLIIQNYSECLHCPVIHPALQKVSHYMSGENEAPTTHYSGGRMVINDGCTTMSMSGKSPRQPLPGLSAADQRHVYYYAIFPNLLLSPHPDYLLTHTLWPREAGVTDIICELHFHPDEMKKPGFTAQDAHEFWDVTNKQDWEVSEWSQKGIASRGYLPGPYSNREGLLFGIDEIVVQRMG